MSRSMRTTITAALVLSAVGASVVAAVVTGDWGLLAVLAGAATVYALAFRSKLNRSQAVPTEHGVDGRLDAIEFFWRPG